MAWLTDRTWTRLLVCGLVVLATCEAASADSRSPVEPVPVVSAEHSIFDPDQPSGAGGGSIAWDGSNFLAAWGDFRNQPRIYFSQVDPEGGLVPPGGQMLSQGGAGQTSPSVSWSGSVYLVAWVDERDGGTGHIYAARVSRSGEVLDSPPLRVSNGVFPSYAPKIAWNGSNFLVVWQQNQGNDQMDVYMARITPGGSVLEPGGVPVAHTDYRETSPAVASDGSDWIVAWKYHTFGYEAIQAARVANDGQVLDSTPILMPTVSDPDSPDIAWDGVNYLVAWHSWQSGQNADVYGARVSPAGVVLDTSAIPISLGVGRQAIPQVSWDGGVFVVTWNDSQTTWGSDVFGARVTSEGSVLDSTPFVVSASPSYAEHLTGAAPGPSGRTALIYDRLAGEPPTGGRTILRFADRGPVASTGTAQAGDFFAFLHGTVNPNTQETGAWFEWGLTPALGSSTPVQVVPAGGEASLSAEIFNLESFTTYYFRLATQNASGSGFGATRVFHTLDTVPPPNPPPPHPPPPPPPPATRPACRVPRVVGRKLGTARSLIRRAGCRVGRIRRARSRRTTGRVVSQIPRGGLRVPLRTHVRLVVSSGRR